MVFQVTGVWVTVFLVKSSPSDGFPGDSQVTVFQVTGVQVTVFKVKGV